MNDASVKRLWEAVLKLETKVERLEQYVEARRKDIARFNKYRLLRPDYCP